MTAPVLIVDDYADAREILRFILTGAGYATIEADSGLEALRLAAAHLPSVILMDIFMPGMDGLEATQRLKNDPQLKDIPIVAYSARPSAVQGSEALFVAMLPKPCTPELVLETVERATSGNIS